MKRYIYIIAILFGLVVASCSNDDKVDVGGNLVTFTVKVPVISRGVIPVTIDRYVMEVWEDANCTVPANVFDQNTTPTNRKVTVDGIYTINLDRTKQYTCLFWADNGAGNVYDVTTLKSVTLKSSAEPVEAFSSIKLVSGELSSQSIMLNRAVASVSLVEKDYISPNSNLKVVYNQQTAFNVLKQQVMGTPIERTKNFAITTEVAATPSATVLLAKLVTLASVADVDKELVSMNVTLNSETPKTITNVPLQANHNTNIVGEFGVLAGRSFVISLNDVWTPFVL